MTPATRWVVYRAVVGRRGGTLWFPVWYTIDPLPSPEAAVDAYRMKFLPHPAAQFRAERKPVVTPSRRTV